MCKSVLTLLSLLTCFAHGFASEVPETVEPLVREDEVVTMDHLLAVTQGQLEVQKQLKALMLEFKQHQEIFFKGEQTKERAYKMVTTARRILSIITDKHMQHLFSSEYLQELAMCSSIAGKSKPTRP